ncbi:MAG: glycoside hydrolase family 3 C-terminal domain-containing protein [Planctomycetes bacterium]|nr:glycoside hydrolase family 3 C-terminal domain-containing protein [Planctomycetota bacterium]
MISKKHAKVLIFTFLLLISVFIASASIAAEKTIYLNSQAPVEDRIEDLISRMTLEEKIKQLGGDETRMSTLDNERLGIPGFKMADGPHGVSYGKATCFPGSLGQACSWDTDLISRIGQALGREFRGKGRYVGLGPCINIIRDPRGGRSFETMGEDPYLTSQLAVAYIKGLQSQKVIAVPKHYACNNQENGRMKNNVVVSERSLRELYLPAFRACIEDAGAMGIMSAYNKVNELYCSENPHLLTDILKNEWGFKGIVICDWGACHSTAASANAGLDVEMPHADYFGQQLLDAVENWEVPEETINEAVRRVLRAKFWAGVFENPVEPDESAVNTPQHQALALEAARKAIVLLKNEKSTLPLNKNKIKKIALIGPNAHVARPCGGGSSYITPFYAVSALDGIKNRVGDNVRIDVVRGCNINNVQDSFHTIKLFRPTNATADESGLLGEYYNNIYLSGEPTVRKIDATVDFDWGVDSPSASINSDGFSVRWTGKLTPEKTGEYELAATNDDGSRLFLDDKLLIDDWTDHGTETHSVKVTLEAGREYDIRFEYYEKFGGAVAKLSWNIPQEKKQINTFMEAKKAAEEADVAIVVVGTTAEIETEGHDRDTLALPGRQDELIKAVFEANPKTIVVLISGSAALMDKWIDKVPAVLECWFGGQEAGNAIADVIFGNYNPSGKLPITFPLSEQQLPSFGNDYETAGESRGYRYYEKQNLKPLFPFGYGLSYTNFKYSNLKVKPQLCKLSDTVTVSVDVSNTGKRTGDEIVQLYVGDVKASVERPLKELKGFNRVTLQPGQTKTVTFTLGSDCFAFYDVDAKKFVTEPGAFKIMAGTNSADYLTAGLEIVP